MNIDFHYGVIYAVCRLGGLDRNQAEIVAHSCQYIDDSTVPGLLKFSGGESFERFASAHKMFDYKNADNDVNRLVWVPFHFLPAGDGATLEEKAVCRPNSEVAKEMIRRALNANGAENSLHRLGVTLHVYVDTWAHQGFSGITSNYNKLSALAGDEHDEHTWLGKLRTHLGILEDNLEASVLDIISGLGHGAALHFPDMPWAKWRYVNGHGQPIERNNLPDFVEAANMACKVVRAYVAGISNFESQPGLPEKTKGDLEKLLAENRSHDEAVRFSTFCQKIEEGAIDGIKEVVPPYIPKGPGSWKAAATGIQAQHDDGTEQPLWSLAFEASDYRKFHDAVKEHLFVVTQEILPDAGMRLI